MGIPTLISTANAASAVSAITITSGIDSTYDHYMFVCTDIHPTQNNNAKFRFQVNASGEAGYNEAISSTRFTAYHGEGGGGGGVEYDTGAGDDQVPSDAADQNLTNGIGGGDGINTDESAAGILHLFSPASTTFVKNFYYVFNNYEHNDYTYNVYGAGYINVTAAITDIEFTTNNGDFTGVIQLYGIA